MSMKRKFFSVIAGVIVFFVFTGIGFSEIYKYQDENGNWRFTDSPPVIDPEIVEKMDGMTQGEETDGLMDLAKELNDRFHPEDDIVAASLATVTVTSSVGTGSGFFVSSNGYILTNKHVIWGDEKQAEAVEEVLDHVDGEIENAENKFIIEEKALEAEKAYLDDVEDALKKLSAGSSQRKRLEKQYKLRVEYYHALKKGFEDRKKRFENGREEYEGKKSDYESNQVSAGLSNSFTITLKNGTELNAYLERASKDHDLALLKLDGYKTPYISPGDSASLSQGQSVCAIGSPIGLRDSVSKGVVSGFTENYIKTDARIYPGNSGGPLITEEGQVVGINTLKKLTRNFEGLGFAIPIETAISEFDRELGR
jgi:serine protease Do